MDWQGALEAKLQQSNSELVELRASLSEAQEHAGRTNTASKLEHDAMAQAMQEMQDEVQRKTNELLEMAETHRQATARCTSPG